MVCEGDVAIEQSLVLLKQIPCLISFNHLGKPFIDKDMYYERKDEQNVRSAHTRSGGVS